LAPAPDSCEGNQSVPSSASDTASQDQAENLGRLEFVTDKPGKQIGYGFILEDSEIGKISFQSIRHVGCMQLQGNVRKFAKLTA
jgi:hypothetical protein